jgi:hypothetical protein
LRICGVLFILRRLNPRDIAWRNRVTGRKSFFERFIQLRLFMGRGARGFGGRYSPGGSLKKVLRLVLAETHAAVINTN